MRRCGSRRVHPGRVGSPNSGGNVSIQHGAPRTLAVGGGPRYRILLPDPVALGPRGSDHGGQGLCVVQAGPDPLPRADPQPRGEPY